MNQNKLVVLFDYILGVQGFRVRQCLSHPVVEEGYVHDSSPRFPPKSFKDTISIVDYFATLKLNPFHLILFFSRIHVFCIYLNLRLFQDTSGSRKNPAIIWARVLLAIFFTCPALKNVSFPDVVYQKIQLKTIPNKS